MTEGIGKPVTGTRFQKFIEWRDGPDGNNLVTYDEWCAFPVIIFTAERNILGDLRDADRRGVAPPQNWTTRAADEIQRLNLRIEDYQASCRAKQEIIDCTKVVIKESAAKIQALEAAAYSLMKQKAIRIPTEKMNGIKSINPKHGKN